MSSRTRVLTAASPGRGRTETAPPLESLLLQADERQLAQAVLNLLRQRAAEPVRFGGGIRTSGGLGLPASSSQIIPSACETQLETVRIRLLGFFESAGSIHC